MYQLAQIVNHQLPTSIGATTYKTVGPALSGIILGLISVMFLFVFFLTFLYLILGGLQWVSSGGDKAGLEAARNKITHAFVGLILVASSWAMMALIAAFFGLKFPNIPIPTINNTTNNSATQQNTPNSTYQYQNMAPAPQGAPGPFIPNP